MLLQLGIPVAGFGDVAEPLLRRQLADGVQEHLAGFLHVGWHGNTFLQVRRLPVAPPALAAIVARPGNTFLQVRRLQCGFEA